MIEFNDISASMMDAAMQSDMVVNVGEYSLPNNEELGDQMLQRVEAVMDPYSQAGLGNMIKEGGLYLDVGSGLGSMSRFIARKTGSSALLLR